jgi:anti-sigma factor RsiW
MTETRIDDLLLMAYVDGEIDAATAREVERAIVADPAIAARARLLRDTAAYSRAAFAEVLHEEIPERLMAALGPAVPAARVDPSPPSALVRSLSWRGMGWALAAAIALFVVGSGGLVFTGVVEPPTGLQLASGDRWLDHVAGFYDEFAKTKIEEERLLVDFHAEDVAELERWFGARLGRPLSVPDLTAKGFHLQGGRLLIIGGKPAAQFLYYSDTGDLVGLVIAINEIGDRQARHDTRRNLNIVHWRKAGYAYALVGKIGPQRLQGLADDAWHALDTI